MTLIASVPPAEIGMSLRQVDTPALLIDLDAFERNLERMRTSLTGSRTRLRPHAKTHKCPLIALQQIDRGAVGVCCQKVGEAEAMVDGGVGDVFVSNEIVGSSKLHRLLSLAEKARIAVCADDPFHVDAYGRAAGAHGAVLDVFVELNVGAERCGLDPGPAVVDLARRITQTPSLRFAGLQAYHGSAQHMRTPAERREAVRSAVQKVVETKALLETEGLGCETVTGAGTGTYLLEAASGVYDELQPGSYIFMDVDYAKNLDEAGQPQNKFEHSLFVYTTVISRPHSTRAVVDAGHKALPVDSGLPAVYGLKDVEYVSPSDEHGKLTLHHPQVQLNIGDRLMLIPGHCDPTVNLFDWYVGTRGGRVEALWPITARGAMR